MQYNGFSSYGGSTPDGFNRALADDPALFNKAEQDLQDLLDREKASGARSLTRDEHDLIWVLSRAIPAVRAYLSQSRVDIAGHTFRAGDRVVYGHRVGNNGELGLGRIVEFKLDGKVKWRRDGADRDTTIENVQNFAYVGE